MSGGARVRILTLLALCAGAYFYGLPYLLFGSMGDRCDYFGLQGHRWIYAPYAECPMVKMWQLRYPIFATYQGDAPPAP